MNVYNVFIYIYIYIYIFIRFIHISATLVNFTDSYNANHEMVGDIF
jgi:hypothetical protein